MARAEPGSLTEIDATKMLERIRAETAAEAEGSALVDISFDTISSTGPNGAINHYRVTRAQQPAAGEGRPLSGRFRCAVPRRDDGRDAHASCRRGDACAARPLPRPLYARPEGAHRTRQGALPEGRRAGAQIDALARASLWSAGLDFDHGTGHGVGVYLSVHEGPQRISKTGHVAARDRHDPFERAGILRGRRLRDQAGEPDRRPRPGAGAGRRPADAFLRDDHARTLRAAADRAGAPRSARSEPGSTPITPASTGRYRALPASAPKSAPGSPRHAGRSAEERASRPLRRPGTIP